MANLEGSHEVQPDCVRAEHEPVHLRPVCDLRTGELLYPSIQAKDMLAQQAPPYWKKLSEQVIRAEVPQKVGVFIFWALSGAGAVSSMAGSIAAYRQRTSVGNAER